MNWNWGYCVKTNLVGRLSPDLHVSELHRFAAEAVAETKLEKVLEPERRSSSSIPASPHHIVRLPIAKKRGRGQMDPEAGLAFWYIDQCEWQRTR